MKKKCSQCGRLKSVKLFHKRSKSADGLKPNCKKCHREAERHGQFLRNLSKLYGVTKEAYDALLASQGGRCWICRRLFKKSPHVDHDHKTGKVRGLLCNGCNRGLGYFHDDPERLAAAIRYLQRTR